MNSKIFLRNFSGSLICFFFVFVVMFLREHELFYSVKYGLLNALIAALLLSTFFLILNPYETIEIKEKVKITKLKQRIKQLNNLKNNEVYLDKTNTLLGEVKFHFENDILIIRGSRSRIRKIIYSI